MTNVTIDQSADSTVDMAVCVPQLRISRVSLALGA